MEMPPFLTMADAKGNQYGVCIRQDIWLQIQREVVPRIEQIIAPTLPEKPEPVADWEMLKEYWDFDYPPDQMVVCDECGEKTEDWAADDPRKFKLKAATLAGLVNFECQKCKARIVKRHFKDKYKFECKPFVQEKSKP